MSEWLTFLGLFSFGIMFGYAAGIVFSMALNWTQQDSHTDVEGVGWERRSDASRFSESELQAHKQLSKHAIKKMNELLLGMVRVQKTVQLKKGARNAHALQHAIEEQRDD